MKTDYQFIKVHSFKNRGNSKIITKSFTENFKINTQQKFTNRFTPFCWCIPISIYIPT